MKLILRPLSMAVTVLLLAILMSGCIDLGVSYSDKDEVIDVDYYKQQCNKNSASLCFTTRDDAKKNFTVFENLDGFTDFQWGTRYSLKVETSFDNKGRPSRYRYQSTSKEAAVNTAFALTLYTASNILTSSDQLNWSLAGEKNFTASVAQGQAIQEAVSAQQVIQLEFTAVGDELTLIQVKCSASENDFSADCEGVSSASWNVAHFQSDCNQASGELCLIYRINDSDDWELLRTEAGNINNFAPDWGLEYSIEVNKTLSSGGQLVSASLKKNDSDPTDKQGIDNNFVFVLNAGFLNKSDSDNKIRLYDGGQVMVCDSLCSRINSANDSDHMLLLDAYVQDAEVFVSAIRCDENPGEDFDQCIKQYNDDASDEDDISWWPPLN